jgi:hypothetical protein
MSEEGRCKKIMKNNNLIITVVAVVVVGAAGFFCGMQYQKTKRPQFANNQFQRQMMNGQGQNSGRAGSGGIQPVSGEIIVVDDKTVTVKMQDGSSKIVILSDSTVINKTQEGSKADLKKGDRMTAFGKSNSDGSITAQNISLGEMFFRGQFGKEESKN